MLIDVPIYTSRLRALLPKGWFSDNAPILDAVLACFAQSWAWLSEGLTYVTYQTRIATATDEWLDLIGADFFGSSLRRLPNELDDTYRARIRSNLLTDAVTRQALVVGVERLTRSTARVFEPSNCRDTGAYGSSDVGADGSCCGFAYGLAGGWGNLRLPYQVFLTIITEPQPGDPMPIGYGVPGGGYSEGAYVYTALSQVPGGVTDDDIRQVVRRLLPVNCTAWLRFI